MLTDAKLDKFDVFLLNDLSRLGRNKLERERVIQRFDFRGIRIIGISDGYDSNSNQLTRKILRGVKGIIDEVYLDNLAKETHEGQMGRACRSFSCGGRAYDYRNIG